MSWWVSLGIRYADHNNICVTIIAHLFWNKSTRKYVKNATSQYHSTIYTSTCTDTHTHTHTHTHIHKCYTAHQDHSSALCYNPVDLVAQSESGRSRRFSSSPCCQRTTGALALERYQCLVSTGPTPGIVNKDYTNYYNIIMYMGSSATRQCTVWFVADPASYTYPGSN